MIIPSGTPEMIVFFSDLYLLWDRLAAQQEKKCDTVGGFYHLTETHSCLFDLVSGFGCPLYTGQRL